MNNWRWDFIHYNILLITLFFFSFLFFFQKFNLFRIEICTADKNSCGKNSESTFNSTPAGTTIGLKDKEWGQIGVIMIAGTEGWIMLAPAATAYAVDPVGVLTIRPSPCTLVTCLPSMKRSMFERYGDGPRSTTTSFSTSNSVRGGFVSLFSSPFRMMIHFSRLLRVKAAWPKDKENKSNLYSVFYLYHYRPFFRSSDVNKLLISRLSFLLFVSFIYIEVIIILNNIIEVTYAGDLALMIDLLTL